ncbi:hypothetical protein V6N11_065156 [Hibiscus sabdariffa]|uniref:Uncharacterized protein n=1 Tax=Hibiscus sabdariffa TaxID=183260 RepID=A0ABR2SJ16_9ROSI
MCYSCCKTLMVNHVLSLLCATFVIFGNGPSLLILSGHHVLAIRPPISLPDLLIILTFDMSLMSTPPVALRGVLIADSLALSLVYALEVEEQALTMDYTLHGKKKPLNETNGARSEGKMKKCYI